MRKNKILLVFFLLTASVRGFLLAESGTAPLLSPEYFLTIPKGDAKNLPVLVVFPGLKTPAVDEQKMWAFSTQKEGLALIVVNVDYDRIGKREDVEAAHLAVSRIVREVAKTAPINPNEVVLGGTSRGGMLAIALGTRFSGDYRGVASLSGNSFFYTVEETMPSAKGQHYLLLQGSEDKVIPRKFFDFTREKLKENGAIVEDRVIQGAGHNLTGEYRGAVKWAKGRL